MVSIAPKRLSSTRLNSIGYSSGGIRQSRGGSGIQSPRPITPQIKPQELNIPKAMIDIPKPQITMNPRDFDTSRPPILDFVDKHYGTEYEPQVNDTFNFNRPRPNHYQNQNNHQNNQNNQNNQNIKKKFKHKKKRLF